MKNPLKYLPLGKECINMIPLMSQLISTPKVSLTAINRTFNYRVSKSILRNDDHKLQSMGQVISQQLQPNSLSKTKFQCLYFQLQAINSNYNNRDRSLLCDEKLRKKETSSPFKNDKIKLRTKFFNLIKEIEIIPAEKQYFPKIKIQR